MERDIEIYSDEMVDGSHLFQPEVLPLKMDGYMNYANQIPWPSE